MIKNTPMDEFLGKRLETYDRWLEKDLISHSSRVVPVAVSFTSEQWVLPAEQVQGIIGNAATIAVQPCECRSHYQRCDHPREVCLIFDRVAEALVSRGEARMVARDEAERILDRARRSGLIHLSLYRPDHMVYALCSCCTCCCHDLQIVMQYGRKELMVRSQYMAQTCHQDCILCGDCVETCPVGARRLDGDRLVFSPDTCLGCGLCVPDCPADAVSMVLRQ